MTDQLNQLSSEFIRIVPNLVGAILVLLIGYIVARIIKSGVKVGLIKAGLDRAMSASPAGKMIDKITKSPSNVIGLVVFWAIFLGAVSLAVSVLGISALTAFVAAIYSYLPNVVAAFLILLVATGVSAAVSGLATRAMGDTPTGKLIASIAPGLIFSIAVFMVLNQLQIAPAIVTITYAAIIGSVALGAALAFGLGGRDVAAQMLEQAYHKGTDQMSQVRLDMAQGKERGRSMVQDAKQKFDNQEKQTGHRGMTPASSFGENMESFEVPRNGAARKRE